MKRINQILKNKKGFACIDAIPAILALIIALAAFMDIFIILKKISVISSTATYVARTIGPQGGTLNKTPSYYPGCTNKTSDTGRCTYVNPNVLRNNVNDMLGAVGLTENNYTLTITAKDKNGQILQIYDLTNPTENSKGINTDYGNYLEVNLTIDYEWIYTSNILPLAPKYNKSSIRNVMSTFKIREG